MAIGILIRTNVPTISVEEAEELEDFYKILNCDMIEVAIRKIGGREFDIICDENGLFAEKIKVSAIDKKTRKPMLVGNLFICHHNDEGEFTDISSEELLMIGNNLVIAQNKDGESWPVVLLGVG